MKTQVYVSYAEHYTDQCSELLLDVFSAPEVMDALSEAGRERRVAVVDDTVVGYLAFGRVLNYLYWDLKWLATMDQYQGKGIGRLLVDHMKAYVVLHNGCAIRLETPKNSAARKFYERLGFELQTTYNDYYDVTNHACVYVWKNPCFCAVEIEVD